MKFLSMTLRKPSCSEEVVTAREERRRRLSAVDQVSNSADMMPSPKEALYVLAVMSFSSA